MKRKEAISNSINLAIIVSVFSGNVKACQKTKLINQTDFSKKVRINFWFAIVNRNFISWLLRHSGRAQKLDQRRKNN